MIALIVIDNLVNFIIILIILCLNCSKKRNKPKLLSHRNKSMFNSRFRI